MTRMILTMMMMVMEVKMIMITIMMMLICNIMKVNARIVIDGGCRHS